jgi:dTDP-4-amino-4,6-dideoxygalactose transaminase
MIFAERAPIDCAQCDSSIRISLYARTLPALRAYSFAIGEELKNARRLGVREALLLPIHPFMSDGDVEQVLAPDNSWTGSKTSCTPS